MPGRMDKYKAELKDYKQRHRLQQKNLRVAKMLLSRSSDLMLKLASALAGTPGDEPDDVLDEDGDEHYSDPDDEETAACGLDGELNFKVRELRTEIRDFMSSRES